MSAQETTRVRAPEITGGRGWLNTDKPLSLAALKGKVVLLDFWTYGCINCIHIIPDLKKLEQKYANQLVVIGVHSAKFENEKDTENIRRIILRYEIEHPVYNDAEFKVWQNYAVRAWPTQYLIDPAGYIIGRVEGEGNAEILDQTIAKTVAEFRKRGELNEEPLKLTLERAKVGDLPLAFPGKILADARNDRLFIADSNHNRIVITKLDGTLLETIGTSERGSADGAFDKALSSPWDLQLLGRQLFITMAGMHQIWKLDLDKNEVSTFAGSGREARLDGPLVDAGFAQPSGITTDGKKLYVADSEANIIRAIDPTAGAVQTLVGGDLFEFGDVDGSGDDVRLQHPLGIFAYGDKLLIADTYNHKIKELDPKARTVKTFLGTGKPGQTDGTTAAFYEPGGLSVASGKLYIADTNNHAIRVVDLKTKETSTLMIKGLQPPTALAELRNNDGTPNAEETKVATQQLRADSNGMLVVSVGLPPGYHLNPAAPQRYRVSVESGEHQLGLISASVLGVIGRDQAVSQTSKNLQLPLRIPFHAFEPGTAALRVQLTLFYCREDNTGVCRIKTLVWSVPVEVANNPNASSEIKLQGKLAAA